MSSVRSMDMPFFKQMKRHSRSPACSSERSFSRTNCSTSYSVSECRCGFKMLDRLPLEMRPLATVSIQTASGTWRA
jgi:hypothetical protein